MYKIMGADQREYGPVAAEEVREWIAQGRANGQTLAVVEGGPWKPLSTFPEFVESLRAQMPPPIASSPYAGQPQRTNSAAVAGLVLSLLGMCCLPFSIVGLILSVMGLLQIRQSPNSYSTSIGIPIAGIFLALLSLVFTIVAVWSGAFDEMIRQLQK